MVVEADCGANAYYRVVQYLDAALVPEVDPGSYKKRDYCELHYLRCFAVAVVVVVSAAAAAAAV